MAEKYLVLLTTYFKENNIYMKWILSQEGVQILKKYKILLEKRNS